MTLKKKKMNMSYRWQNLTLAPKAQEKRRLKKFFQTQVSFKSSAQKRIKGTNEYSTSSFF